MHFLELYSQNLNPEPPNVDRNLDGVCCRGTVRCIRDTNLIKIVDAVYL